MRSHPNKAVDVDACPNFKRSSLLAINSYLVCSSSRGSFSCGLVLRHSTQRPPRLLPPARARSRPVPLVAQRGV